MTGTLLEIVIVYSHNLFYVFQELFFVRDVHETIMKSELLVAITRASCAEITHGTFRTADATGT